MSENPYQSPVAPDAKGPQTGLRLVSEVIRSSGVGVLIWLALIAASAVCGGFLSVLTGQMGELPKWNGWSYYVFGVKEGAMFGAVLTWPIAVITSLVVLVRSWWPAVKH